MPNNKRLTKKSMQGAMENIHPSSRRSGQLDRIVLRKTKLSKEKNYRKRANAEKLERPLFFHHSLPPPPFVAHTLPELHELISQVYLERNDDELAQLKKERRAGRVKCRREIEIEEIKRKELSEYQSGFEVPDLTHEPTVALMRSWESCDPSFLPLLRYIRINSKDPELVVVAHRGLGRGVDDEFAPQNAAGAEEGDEAMEE